MCRAKGLVAKDRAEFFAAARAALNNASTSGISLEVTDEGRLAEVQYTAQGNADFYTEDMVKLRHAVRSDPAFVAAMREWWRWVRCSAASHSTSH